MFKVRDLKIVIDEPIKRDITKFDIRIDADSVFQGPRGERPLAVTFETNDFDIRVARQDMGENWKYLSPMRTTREIIDHD